MVPLPKIYNKQIFAEELLLSQYPLFKDAIGRGKEEPEYLLESSSFKDRHPHLDLKKEDLAVSSFRDRSEEAETSKIEWGYGLTHLGLPLCDLSLSIPDEVWFGGEKPGLRERLKLPEGSVGCLLPSIFVGLQQTFPLSLVAEQTGEHNWYNEFSFIYKVVNGGSEEDHKKGVEQLHKKFLQKLFSLNYEILLGERDWEADKERRSVKKEGEAYINWLSEKGYHKIAEHREKWHLLWNDACDSLKYMSEFSNFEQLNHHLVSYALLAAEELPHLSAWNAQLHADIRDPNGLTAQLKQVLDVKLRGGEDLAVLENAIKGKVLETLR